MNIALPKNTIVEVVGNVGTGKTTLSKKLAKKLGAKYIDVDPFVENPFLQLYVKNRKKLAFTTALHFSYSRSELIPKVTTTLPSPIILDHGFESGLFMYPLSSFQLGEMTEDEWEFLQKIHAKLMEKLPPVTISIFLNLDSKSIMERLKKRGRQHEALYSQKYIEQLQKGLDEYKKLLIKKRLRKSIFSYNQDGILDFYGKRNTILEDALC